MAQTSQDLWVLKYTNCLAHTCLVRESLGGGLPKNPKTKQNNNKKKQLLRPWLVCSSSYIISCSENSCVDIFVSPDLFSWSDPELRRETSVSISAAHTSLSEFTGHQLGQSSSSDCFALHHCGLESFPFLNLTCCRGAICHHAVSSHT